ncbi:hypothetical protein [Thermogymnomonas acidicola]|uniref:hypothetical protein n=1 Tax=Thermogymnomonas acidicola TaxID=399579 RepID=UPI0009462926|nr:hypothetical protein [Thermogymnomonas acidicola]
MDIPKRGISETILGKDPLHIQDLPLRRVPDYMRKKGGFLYWTGALVSIAFIYQVITGLLLLLYYNPANAYATTETIINEVPFGPCSSQRTSTVHTR